MCFAVCPKSRAQISVVIRHDHHLPDGRPDSIHRQLQSRIIGWRTSWILVIADQIQYSTIRLRE
jgi:hypothetical protein